MMATVSFNAKKLQIILTCESVDEYNEALKDFTERMLGVGA